MNVMTRQTLLLAPLALGMAAAMFLAVRGWAAYGDSILLSALANGWATCF